MRTAVLLFSALSLTTCCSGAPRVDANAKPTTEFVSNQRIAYSDGLHNENTELGWFGGKLFLAFRGGGSGQTGTPDAHIEVFVSRDAGDTFAPVAQVSIPDRDIRDPKFVVRGDKLVMYAISRIPGFQFRDAGGQAWTVRSESTDGVHWTPPVRIYDETWGFWRFVEKDGTLYATGYNDGDLEAALFASADGIHWEKRGSILDSPADIPSEAELHFIGDRAVSLVRLDNEGLVNDGQTAICLSDPPYRDWSCDRRLPERLDGPVWFTHHHGQTRREIVVARKHLPHTKKRTAIYELVGDLTDPSANVTAKELVELQGTGDTAYAAVAKLTNDQWLLSWYSSPIETDLPWLVGQFAPSDIWLAWLDFDKPLNTPPPPPSDDGGAPPPPTSHSFAGSGTFLLSIAADFSPDPPYRFLATTTTTLAADEEVVARVALDDEAEAAQHLAAALVGGDVVRLHAVEPERVEHVRDRARERLAHDPLADHAPIEAVAEDRGLEAAAHDLVEVDVTEQGASVVAPAEDAEAQAEIARVLVVVALDAARPVRLGEVAGRARRLPRAEVLLVFDREGGVARRGLDGSDGEQEARGLDDGRHASARRTPRRGGACLRAAALRARPRWSAWWA
jgi:hypothetical protein